MTLTTGVCDENDKCFCSEEDYNFFHDVTLWLGKLDISEVVKRQINKFQRKIGSTNSFIQKYHQKLFMTSKKRNHQFNHSTIDEF